MWKKNLKEEGIEEDDKYTRRTNKNLKELYSEPGIIVWMHDNRSVKRILMKEEGGKRRRCYGRLEECGSKGLASRGKREQQQVSSKASILP